MAEGVGFEPTGHPRRPTVFKTVAFNRSATPPAAFIVRRRDCPARLTRRGQILDLTDALQRWTSLPTLASAALRNQHRGSMNESITQRRQSLVSLRQPESAHLGTNRHSRYEGEELFCIVT